MITDGNKLHYLAVSNLSALLAKKASNHNHCIESPKFAERIINFAHGEKSLWDPFAIYLDLECLGVYHYEDMDNWEKFDKTIIPPKEAFYSNINEEGISNVDYAHVKKYGKYSE